MKILEYFCEAKKQGKPWAEDAISCYYNYMLRSSRSDSVEANDLMNYIKSKSSYSKYPPDCILAGFDWRKTPHGRDYWCKIYDKECELNEN
jgi:hypothetical protein